MGWLNEIWEIALDAAGGIFTELIGQLLGLAIVAAMVAVPALLIYLVLKKMGIGPTINLGSLGNPRRFGFRMHYVKKPGEPLGKLEIQDAAPAPPVEAGAQWQQDLLESWKQEDQAKRQAFVARLDQHRRFVMHLYRWVVAAGLMMGAVFFGYQALKWSSALLAVAGVAMAGGAAIAYVRLEPSASD
jgi:hypothetical protein